MDKYNIQSFFEEVRLPQNPIFIIGYPRSGTTLFQMWKL